MNRRVAILLGLVLAAGTACRTAMNYTDPLGPRYAGGRAVAPRPRDASDTLRFVTFNIQFAKHIPAAIALLESEGALRDADIITLQEMDAPGTAKIAAALGMLYVYYPATVHPSTRRDFGNAILSRWPIVDDHKIILPHLGRFVKTQRTATAATVRVGGVTVRVYSLHLATMVGQGPGGRRDQMRAVLADAAGYERVVVGGDLNSHDLGSELRARGFAWPTEHNPHTDRFWNWDHIFLKGLAPAGVPSTGVIRDTLHASDHRPVWVAASLPGR